MVRRLSIASGTLSAPRSLRQSSVGLTTFTSSQAPRCFKRQKHPIVARSLVLGSAAALTLLFIQVLYLGAAAGTTVSHVSDLVGEVTSLRLFIYCSAVVLVLLCGPALVKSRSAASRVFCFVAVMA